MTILHEPIPNPHPPEDLDAVVGVNVQMLHTLTQMNGGRLSSSDLDPTTHQSLVLEPIQGEATFTPEDVVKGVRRELDASLEIVRSTTPDGILVDCSVAEIPVEEGKPSAHWLIKAEYKATAEDERQLLAATFSLLSEEQYATFRNELNTLTDKKVAGKLPMRLPQGMLLEQHTPQHQMIAGARTAKKEAASRMRGRRKISFGNKVLDVAQQPGHHATEMRSTFDDLYRPDSQQK